MSEEKNKKEIVALHRVESRSRETLLPITIILSDLHIKDGGWMVKAKDLPQKITFTPLKLEIEAQYPDYGYDDAAIDQIAKELEKHPNLKARKLIDTPCVGAFDYDIDPPRLFISGTLGNSASTADMIKFLDSEVAHSFMPEEGITFMKSEIQKISRSASRV